MSTAQAVDEVESSRQPGRHTAVARGRRRARVVAAFVALVMALLCQVAAPQVAGALPVGDPIRVSEMGPEGENGYGPPPFTVKNSAVAYSPDADRYLVVWTGLELVWTNHHGWVVPVKEHEIWGQILDGNGDPVGSDFRISQTGPTGGNGYIAAFPSVAYNSVGKEFLVAWAGNDNLPGMSSGEWEIFGQRVSLNGAQVGPDDFRISQMGPAGNDKFNASYPSVAYNTALNEYLVVWSGDTSISGKAVDEEYEVFAQRVSAAGTEIGSDTRITNVGPDSDPNYDAQVPDVVYNAAAGEYLVVFGADDDVNGMKDNEREILGQRLSAKAGSVGAQIGADEFRISHVGPDAGADQLKYEALHPAVALDPSAGRYLVVWEGDHHKLGGSNDDFDIWGQALYASGASAGKPAGSMIRISQLGPELSPMWWSGTADVAYNAGAGRFLVTWGGEDNVRPLVQWEFEIYGQAVSVTGGTAVAIGPDDFRISQMGPDGDINYGAFTPAVAARPSSTGTDYLVTWAGDTKDGTLVDGDYEVWARRVTP